MEEESHEGQFKIIVKACLTISSDVITADLTTLRGWTVRPFDHPKYCYPKIRVPIHLFFHLYTFTLLTNLL